MNKKPKILYISSVIPDTSCGAHIAIYRHFVYKNDFDVAVCSYSAANSETDKKFIIPMHKLRRRFQNTRLSRLLWNFHYFLSWYFLPSDLVRYARQFNPDIIMTVPDNIHSGFSVQLSKKLGKPLVIDLQDLFPLSQFISDFMKPFEMTRKFLLGKFIQLHNKADLAFYTSEGMLAYFPKHKNGHVLYPVGDFSRPSIPINSSFSEETTPLDERPYTIVYAGNCYGAYGRMLLRFAKLVINTPELHLKIFPVGKGWADEDIDVMTKAGIYQKFTPFEQLKLEFEKADAFLTVMSFEEPEKPFVATSFTTKWLDYAPYGKPIFAWGPDYSSACIFAQKHKCGIIIKTDKEQELSKQCLAVAKAPNLQVEYGQNAKQISDDILNPNNIHQILYSQINKLIIK